jgi:hypothetical protein
MNEQLRGRLYNLRWLVSEIQRRIETEAVQEEVRWPNGNDASFALRDAAASLQRAEAKIAAAAGHFHPRER